MIVCCKGELNETEGTIGEKWVGETNEELEREEEDREDNDFKEVTSRGVRPVECNVSKKEEVVLNEELFEPSKVTSKLVTCCDSTGSVSSIFFEKESFGRCVEELDECTADSEELEIEASTVKEDVLNDCNWVWYNSSSLSFSASTRYLSI